MRRERRNLYRLLHVQPEAPPEVIKAAWRALMSTLRAHPDLGGDPELAAKLNAAYEVLSDPERRAAYDRTLKRPIRASSVPPAPPPAAAPKPPPAQAAHGPSAPPATQARRAAPSPAAATPADCPFCGFTRRTPLAQDPRCLRCDSPLTPAPSRSAAPELLGRRQSERFERVAMVEVWVKGDARPRHARLKDLSFTGLSLLYPVAVAVGSILRVKAPQFEALVQVVACRAQAGQFSLHGQLLTLALDRAGRGVYVDAKA